MTAARIRKEIGNPSGWQSESSTVDFGTPAWSRALYKTPEYKAARAAAVERCGGHCEVCDTKPQTLHAHHRRGIVNDLTHEHLIMLCPSCHEVLEKLARRGRNLKLSWAITLIELALEKIAWKKGDPNK